MKKIKNRIENMNLIGLLSLVMMLCVCCMTIIDILCYNHLDMILVVLALFVIVMDLILVDKAQMIAGITRTVASLCMVALSIYMGNTLGDVRSVIMYQNSTLIGSFCAIISIIQCINVYPHSFNDD